MQTNLNELRSIMKTSGMDVYRDSAPTSAEYPYIVYEYVEESHRRLSNRVFRNMPLYQLAVITNGTERDYEPLRNALDANGVPFSSFFGIPFDENDDTITQFITNVRCSD